MIIRTSLLGLGAAWALAIGSASAMASMAPVPIHCTVQGEKLLAPLTATAICQRFIAAYAGASGHPAIGHATPPADGLIVALDFGPRGLAAADVTPVAGGKRQKVARFGLAVSDRGFTAADIDQLARDAAHGLHATPHQ